MHDFDIVIVGAGFAGLALAHAIAGQGLRTVIIDKRTVCPDIFRAEKIEPHQAQLMRELGILDLRMPFAGPIGRTINVVDSRPTEFDTVEQYGISYSETVNSMRSRLPPNTRIINAVVGDVCPGNTVTITLGSGEVLRSKLVVIATGSDSRISNSLGIKKIKDSDLTSLNFGFYIRKKDGSDFQFNGLNYFLPDNADKILYMTIFPIGKRMRVNLFTELEARDTLSLQLKKKTLSTICKLFPNITAYTGDIDLDSSVQVVATSYYRVTNHFLPGVVVIGDAFQSVSPATGSGLSKVLTDVKTLSNTYIPMWKNKQRIDSADVMAFYHHQEKLACDKRSLKSWYYSDFAPNERASLPSRVRRRVAFSLRYRAQKLA